MTLGAKHTQIITLIIGEINGDIFGHVIFNFNERIIACQKSEGGHMQDVVTMKLEIAENVEKKNLKFGSFFTELSHFQKCKRYLPIIYTTLYMYNSMKISNNW